MALITCPECGKEISDDAKTCPGCGYPLNKNKVDQEGKPKKQISFMAVSLIACAVLVVLFVAYYIATKEPQKPDAHHTALGYSINLGMSKDEVEDVLGKPISGSSQIFRYKDDLVLWYKDGKVDYISIEGHQWETSKGANTLNSAQKIMEIYGDGELSEAENLDIGTGSSSRSKYLLTYHLGEDGNVCDLLKAYRDVTFFIEEDAQTVKGISVSKGFATK